MRIVKFGQKKELTAGRGSPNSNYLNWQPNIVSYPPRNKIWKLFSMVKRWKRGRLKNDGKQWLKKTQK
jgi:hypothetical protein